MASSQTKPSAVGTAGAVNDWVDVPTTAYPTTPTPLSAQDEVDDWVDVSGVATKTTAVDEVNDWQEVAPQEEESLPLRAIGADRDWLDAAATGVKSAAAKFSLTPSEVKGDGKADLGDVVELAGEIAGGLVLTGLGTSALIAAGAPVAAAATAAGLAYGLYDGIGGEISRSRAEGTEFSVARAATRAALEANQVIKSAKKSYAAIRTIAQMAGFYGYEKAHGADDLSASAAGVASILGMAGPILNAGAKKLPVTKDQINKTTEWLGDASNGVSDTAIKEFNKLDHKLPSRLPDEFVNDITGGANGLDAQKKVDALWNKLSDEVKQVKWQEYQFRQELSKASTKHLNELSEQFGEEIVDASKMSKMVNEPRLLLQKVDEQVGTTYSTDLTEFTLATNRANTAAVPLINSWNEKVAKRAKELGVDLVKAETVANGKVAKESVDEATAAIADAMTSHYDSMYDIMHKAGREINKLGGYTKQIVKDPVNLHKAMRADLVHFKEMARSLGVTRLSELRSAMKKSLPRDEYFANARRLMDFTRMSKSLYHDKIMPSLKGDVAEVINASKEAKVGLRNFAEFAKDKPELLNKFNALRSRVPAAKTFGELSDGIRSIESKISPISTFGDLEVATKKALEGVTKTSDRRELSILFSRAKGIADRYREANPSKAFSNYVLGSMKALHTDDALSKLHFNADLLEQQGMDNASNFLRGLIRDNVGTKINNPNSIELAARKIRLGMERVLGKLPNTSEEAAARGVDIARDTAGYALTAAVHQNLVMSMKGFTQNLTQFLTTTMPEIASANPRAVKFFMPAMQRTVKLARSGKLHNFLEDRGVTTRTDDIKSAVNSFTSELHKLGGGVGKAVEINDKVRNFISDIWGSADRVVRAAAYQVGDVVAEAANAGDKVALDVVRSLPRPVRIQLRQAGGLGAKNAGDIIGSHLNSSTLFHYGPTQASELARMVGPKISMFTKFPTATTSDFVYNLGKGDWPKLGMKYALPLIVTSGIDEIRDLGVESGILPEEASNISKWMFGRTAKEHAPAYTILTTGANILEGNLPFGGPYGRMPKGAAKVAGKVLEGDIGQAARAGYESFVKPLNPIATQGIANEVDRFLRTNADSMGLPSDTFEAVTGIEKRNR